MLTIFRAYYTLEISSHYQWNIDCFFFFLLSMPGDQWIKFLRISSNRLFFYFILSHIVFITHPEWSETEEYQNAWFAHRYCELYEPDFRNIRPKLIEDKSMVRKVFKLRETDRYAFYDVIKWCLSQEVNSSTE